MTTYTAGSDTNNVNGESMGVEFTPNKNLTLTNFTTYGTDGGTSWKVGTTRTGSEMGSGSLTSHSTGTISIALSSGVTYYLTANIGGGTFTGRYYVPSWPVNQADFSSAQGVLNNGTSGGWISIASITFSAGPSFTKMQINIGDAWKLGAGMQINIGDAWKQAAGLQVNIGDAWKTIF